MGAGAGGTNGPPDDGRQGRSRPGPDDTPGRIVRSPLRVRFAETDAQGVVYYGNYFVYFEVGRVDLLREARGGPGPDGRDPGAEPGGGINALMVVHAEGDYRAPARFDDQLEVQTWIEALGRTSITFGHRVVRRPGGEELVRGRVVAVHVGKTGRPEPIPGDWRKVLEGYRVPDGVAAAAGSAHTKSAPAGRAPTGSAPAGRP